MDHDTLSRFYAPLLCASALLLRIGTAGADEVRAASYPETAIGDIKYVLTSPARWQQQDWQALGYASAGILGIGLILDRPIRDEMRRHYPNNSPFMLDVERFGKQYSFAVLGGFYLTGVVREDRNAVAVAQDGLTSSIIATGLITPALKLVTGRARPRENLGTAQFHPFSLSYSSNSSFPSGHATQAFAVASVIANHYEAPWVTYSSYTIASLVGVARIYHDAHFASDVVAGSLIGALVGKSVVGHNGEQRPTKIELLPDITPDRLGVKLTTKL
jgi:membrane-associated phospholipid phosphatase